MLKKLLLSLCMLLYLAAAAQDGPTRSWKGNTLPLRPKSGFTPNDEFLRKSDNTYWQWNNVTSEWYPSAYYHPAPLPGPQGPAGPQGPVGPQGPAGGGSGSTTLGFVRWVGTWNEYLQALSDADQGTVRSIQLYQNLQQTSKAYYPKRIVYNLEVEGHGAEILDVVGLDTAHVRTFSSTGASDPVMDFQIHFNNIQFTGKNRNGIGFFIACTYQISWEKCRFSTYKSAIVAPFDLQGKVENCRFWNCAYSGISVIYYVYPGGGPQESSSNHFIIANSCFRSQPGDFTNIYVNGCSGVWIVHCIGEGGDEHQGGLGADYMVYFDDGNSNTTKECNIDMLHIEFRPKIAAICFDVKDGMYSARSLYSQKSDVTLVMCKNKGAYPNIYVSNVPHFAPGMKLSTSDANVRWQFWNMPAEWNAQTASNWMNNAIGNYSLQVGNQPDGRKPYIDLFGRRL